MTDDEDVVRPWIPLIAFVIFLVLLGISIAVLVKGMPSAEKAVIAIIDALNKLVGGA